ncbi:hypothetical protein B9G55_05745 [Saccharibacillus sp. O16]|nr:hypothetical protein B9G55_05745 [Saccharibacillus sp. O16]
MNRSNTEQQLELALKSTAMENKPMSPLVRARLDAAYASLPETAHSSPTVRSTRSRLSPLRRATVVAASTLVISAGLFASGFVSPAMADTIREIPVIGSLFSKMEGDAGLRSAGERQQGLFVDASAAEGDTSMRVKETIFDGSRVAFALELTVPGIKNTSKLEEEIQNVTLNVGGQELGGFFYTSPQKEKAGTYSVLMNLPLNGADTRELGQHFDGTVSVTLQHQEKPLVVHVPFKRVVSAHERHLSPGPSVVGADYTLHVDTFDVTASTVQLATSLTLNDTASKPKQQEDRLLPVLFDLIDDQGRTLDVVGGEGQLNGGTMKYVSNYGADLGQAQYVIIKPYTQADSDHSSSKNYIKDLEVKIDLHANK